MMSAPTGCPEIAAPLPDVETRRLVLRRFQRADLDALTTIFEKPEMWRFPYGRGFTRAETAMFLEAQIAEWDACRLGCWIATEKATDRVVGYVGLSVPHFLPEVLPAVEVGWRLARAAWGRGIATEAARAALAFGFGELGMREIIAIVDPSNRRSLRVCAKLDMTERPDRLHPGTRQRLKVLGVRSAELQWTAIHH
jgi:RimJ/RimL family protein N-acetyltransferase